ncbi:Zinc finger, RING-type [Dillenia turbinata]|uniref:Zinc finger, RING-type n=1 Tax=Dillenia turbinata TaxID=194707 RepID=A0AAN8V3S8_9MAGN
MRALELNPPVPPPTPPTLYDEGVLGLLLAYHDLFVVSISMLIIIWVCSAIWGLCTWKREGGHRPSLPLTPPQRPPAPPFRPRPTRPTLTLPNDTIFKYNKNEPSRCGEDENGCAICLEELTNGDKCRILLKCGHVFHVQCIDQWLMPLANPSCPICRATP